MGWHGELGSVVDAGAETFTFVSQVDQAPIFVRKWLPPCGIRPRATVQITHGIAEHSGRYDRLARFLAAEGSVVYASTCADTDKPPDPTNSDRPG
jgi:alpha-beta hydrolase superfamily lysophospholipase